MGRRAEEGDPTHYSIPKEGRGRGGVGGVEKTCSVLLLRNTADNPQLVGATTVVTSTILTSPTHQASFESFLLLQTSVFYAVAMTL